MGVQMDWEFLRAQLPGNFRELATEMGLIHPPKPQLGAKVTDIEPILRIILHRAGLEVSLATTASEAATGQLIDLSSVAIHKWERKLAPYLAALSAEMLGVLMAIPIRRFLPLWSRRGGVIGGGREFRRGELPG